jgi:hypothetical protein
MARLELCRQRDNTEAARQKSAAAAEIQFGHDFGKNAQKSGTRKQRPC